MIFNEEVREKVKKFVGTGFFKVTAFNPSVEWVKENEYLSTVGRYDENFEFSGKDDDGNKFFVPVVAIESVDNKAGGNGLKLLISIGNRYNKRRVVDLDVTTKTNTHLYRDNSGSFQYKTKSIGDFSENQRKFFDADSAVIAKVGESEFTSFIMTLTGQRNTKEAYASLGLDFEKFFKGGFGKYGKSILATPLKKSKNFLESPINRIGILLGVNDSGYYEVYTDKFLSINSNASVLAANIVTGEHAFEGSDGSTVWHVKEEAAYVKPDVEAENSVPENAIDEVDTTSEVAGGDAVEGDDDLPF